MELCWSLSACCFGIGLCCWLIVVNSTAKRYIRFEHVGGFAVGEHMHVFSRCFCQATRCLLRFVFASPTKQTLTSALVKRHLCLATMTTCNNLENHSLSNAQKLGKPVLHTTLPVAFFTSTQSTTATAAPSVCFPPHRQPVLSSTG